ncbi:MAG: TetR/AcrR family transcriptional regulator [Microbacteriaceae bacterium]
MTLSHPDSSARAPRPSASVELRSIAIEQFASAGFAGTSLQQIADLAGYSKSSVLYHFASKEALLEAALGPALDRLEQILPGVGGLSSSPQARARFIEDFIDFLLEYRLEVHTFINQGQSLRGIPVIDRGNAIIGALAASLTTGFSSTQQKIRFGVALGGAAYALVGGMNFAGDDLLPPEEVRPALIATVSELLAPAAPTDV